MIGQSGLTATVLAEIELALDAHELIKVKIRAERDERKMIIEKICSDTGAELIQTIGQIAVIYRLNPGNWARHKAEEKTQCFFRLAPSSLIKYI